MSKTFFSQFVNQIKPIVLPVRCVKTEGVITSSEYYHRQADTLLTLALIATDPELSARYRNMALEYKCLAANTEHTRLPRAVADAGAAED
jgi:hypothetical protein